jgi:hypothetical protein
MISHRHARLGLRHRTLANLLAVFIALLFLIPHLFAQTPSPAQTGQASACSGTFAGVWRADVEINSPTPSVTLTISVQGDYAEGLYAFGNARRKLAGKIMGDTLTGDWRPEQKGEGGTFSATLSPARHEIVISFFYHQSGLDSSHWFCPPSQAQPSPSPNPQGGTPTPTPSPTPVPSPTTVRGDQDTDNFQTFDALTPAQQAKVLKRSGPRLQLEYNASDFSARVFVKGGWPLILEYALDSDNAAELSITVPGSKPFELQLAPAKQQQISIVLPQHFGPELQVAKLQISAFWSNGRPADFQLLGFAMGQSGVEAIRGVNRSEMEVQLAMAGPASLLESGYEPLALFAPEPQGGTALRISVRLPDTIRVKQTPKNLVSFSCTSRADFSEGRWEWWHVDGLNWQKVWQKDTGSISRNQTKSSTWDGIITMFKLVSKGTHALQLAVWQKSGDDRDWVVARAPSKLTVIE